ncbi:MAG: DNA mismatch repair protein MutS [Flavobacteriaceae bacterium CG_4_8_14_3_um_filter_34_10]|nr:DNA mismatch repair protein MutS [Flavobacteriia bacterium]PIV49068.1 MAG: DNA mismatch repair protein MutS [Flavobacteriaceae bacterium CG02_land_8_20_14_3_00_34_13]PIX10203.1 MAG: DNA mismatch repair protein MutS [Flavobacteriaceae bacterium CG_4_8_14_3_um_filter_34_10]PJC08258.1 MAG: DNA mismatch repair protein MutS [Flavobacteriaceae bacterium CG_4_9_14_0_8_um_filter_34_30]
MKFKIGDTVSVLDEAIEGRVLQIVANRIHVLTEDGFSIEYSEKDLVKIENAKEFSKLSSISKQEFINEKEVPKRKKGATPSRKERLQPAMEVDLHIHQLVPSTKGMDNYDMLTLQLETAKRQLDFAVQKRIQRVVFIHGIGEGVLRTELEYLFKRYENIKFYDADYQKYGRGATEVYFFQNPKV